MSPPIGFNNRTITDATVMSNIFNIYNIAEKASSDIKFS